MEGALGSARRDLSASMATGHVWIFVRQMLMKRVLLGTLVAVLVASGCSRPNAPVQHRRGLSLGEEKIPLGRLPRGTIPLRYRIALTVNPAGERFSGHVEIDVRFAEKKRSIFLHGRGLNILAASARLNARHSIPAHYVQVDKSGVARLIFVDEIPAGRATLVFDYDAPFGKTLSGLYKVVERGDAYAFTQFESISAREAFPSFDEPGFKTPFQLSVVAPNNDKTVSNSPIQSVQRQHGGMTQTQFQWTRPLPTYLIALAVGPFDVVDGGEIAANQFRNHPVRLRGITSKGNGQRVRYALSLTPRILQALESYFAVAYPFPKLDIIAVPNFAAGAMENAGAITFRERLILVDDDAPLDQRRSSLTSQAHEITHQWFGDLVTPLWWDDLWLNESFADWMAYKVAQDVQPQEQFDTETLRDSLDAMDVDELPSARQIHQPVLSPDDIYNAFDAITYEKGAAILSMYESFLGEKRFRDAIHNYLARFAYRNASASDFVDAISKSTLSHTGVEAEKVVISIDNSGEITWNSHKVDSMAALIDQESHMAASVSPAQIASSFAGFIDQPGIPYLHFDLQCSGAALAHATQQPYTPIGNGVRHLTWRIPVCLGVEGQERFCRIADRKASEILLGAACPAALMPNDQGRGYYRFDLNETDWNALIQQSPRLGPADQIALLHNLAAAIYLGDAKPDDLFFAIRTLALTARWDVLSAIDGVLHDLRLRSLTDADLPLYRAFVAANFSKRFQELGVRVRGPEDTGQTLARKWLATLVVSEARDAHAIQVLAETASAELSGDAGRNPAPELLGEALRAGLIANGTAFAKQLRKAIDSSNQEVFRRQAIYAFAGSEDRTQINELLAFALSPRMRTGELRYLYDYMAREPVARSMLWSWYRANYAALLARVSRDGMGRAPLMLSKACDARSSDELQAFFSTRTEQLTGTARTLALAEQAISRCLAFRQTRASGVVAALRAAAH